MAFGFWPQLLELAPENKAVDVFSAELLLSVVNREGVKRDRTDRSSVNTGDFLADRGISLGAS